MTKIIGLTGGIGSGKTTITNYFIDAAIPVYIADNEARLLTQTTAILAAIRETFGETIFDNTILNRERLSAIVFTNPEKRSQLNAIIHPAVSKHFQDWVSKHKNAPLVVYESAILFETGSYKMCDLVLTITAPLETRIQRVMQRDSSTREQVLARINAQWTDEQRKLKSDFVIENSDLSIVKREIDEILKILNNLQ